MGMAWKDALKSLKTFCGQNMTKELEGLEESLKGWESRDEHREASFNSWKAIDEKLRKKLEVTNLQVNELKKVFDAARLWYDCPENEDYERLDDLMKAIEIYEDYESQLTEKKEGA